MVVSAESLALHSQLDQQRTAQPAFRFSHWLVDPTQDPAAWRLNPDSLDFRSARTGNQPLVATSIGVTDTGTSYQTGNLASGSGGRSNLPL